jgi:DNA-directed RNA polymerase subunit E'/Rpb7
MKITKALIQNDEILFFCPHCDEIVRGKVSVLTDKGFVTRCFEMRGYIDQCTATKKFSFIYWNTQGED